MKMTHLETQIASFRTEPINVKPPPVTPGELEYFGPVPTIFVWRQVEKTKGGRINTFVTSRAFSQSRRHESKKEKCYVTPL